MTGYVYFIAIKDRPRSPIKIGYATDPESRLSLLQAANPDDLFLMGVIQGTYKDEALLHRAFSVLHIRNEWFRHTDDLQIAVLGLIANGMDPLRPALEESAKQGFGIRVKSEEGLAVIRRRTPRVTQKQGIPATGFLGEVEAFLSETGMGSSYFSKASCGNSEMVNRLRAGSRVWPETIDKVRAFMKQKRLDA